jgi:hypothetical protein
MDYFVFAEPLYSLASQRFRSAAKGAKTLFATHPEDGPGLLYELSRLRGCAYDPEGPSEMVAESGCTGADSVHPGNPRVEKLSDRM